MIGSPVLNLITEMNGYNKNNESYIFQKPQGFQTIRFHLTAAALEWLDGTTSDDSNTIISNRTLFYDLLSRMQLVTGRDRSFRRPQNLQAGQLQFSEISLAKEWNMGRKKVHNLLWIMAQLKMIAVCNSRIASIADIICIEGWTDTKDTYINNPCCHLKQLG